jgi:16S rRNA (guanine(966)-N(2))-methyltransferase RsmD
LLNSIQLRIPGARVLDLFAGSGALAIEALSRGAAAAVCVENHKQVISVLEQNREELRLGKRLRILSSAVESSWSRIVSEGPYDIVFADPPYAAGWERKLLEVAPWRELLTSDALFCLEWGAKKSESKELPERIADGFLVKVREKIYSESILTTYRHSEGESEFFEADHDNPPLDASEEDPK